jgi:hypothetical protein
MELERHHQPPLVQAEDNDDEEEFFAPISSKKMERPHTKTQIYYIRFLKMGTILTWYYCNSMNVISMQLYARKHRSDGSLSMIFMTSCMITSLQLLSGVLIGQLFLLGLRHYEYLWNSARDLSPSRNHSWLLLSLLHAIGSLSSNLGLVFGGKASIIRATGNIGHYNTLFQGRQKNKRAYCQ